jgi:transposase InsO family protein
MELTGIDQLWIADITYIRLQAEFVYLAVVLDAFSRRVIGWSLNRTLEAETDLGDFAYGAAIPRSGCSPAVPVSASPTCPS